MHVEQGTSGTVRLPADATWGDLRAGVNGQLGHAGDIERCAVGSRAVDVLEDDVPLAASDIGPGASLMLSLNGRSDATLKGGGLAVVAMDDDNHCLFKAVSYALCGGDRTVEGAQALRTLVGALVLADPARWSAAVLAMDPEEYAARISATSAWGGAVELTLLAEHFCTGIVAVDAAANGQTYAFGPSDAPCAFLLYSGIHYDVIVRPSVAPQAVFPAAERQAVLGDAVRLAQRAHAEHRYTDTGKFTLKCGLCGERLVGERDATRHARATGHVSFEEYSDK